MDVPNLSIQSSKANIPAPGFGWATEAVFDDSQVYFDSMLKAIDAADVSIELAVYIFELDEIGNQFVEHLRRAAQRGVRVRVLVDGVGSARSAFMLGEQLTGVGAEFYIYHPLPWYWDDYRWSRRSGSWLQKFWYFLNAINRRDHRKFLIIDSQQAWCGNVNVCVDHINPLNPWRDYGAHISGPAVLGLLDHFNQVWRGERSTTERQHQFNHYCSNRSFRMRRMRNRKLAQSIREAEHRVWICSAYFSPSRAILRALKAARRRGVDIRLIVAGRSDILLFPLLTSTYYADLLKRGIRVYQYEERILHAKVMLVDQHCIIGSTNLNHRSFYHDLELDVILTQPKTIEKMEQWLRRDMEDSHRVRASDISPLHRSFWLGWLPRLLRYWM